MSQNQQPNFSKLRAALWPIHGYELKKFLPMGMMLKTTQNFKTTELML